MGINEHGEFFKSVILARIMSSGLNKTSEINCINELIKINEELRDTKMT